MMGKHMWISMAWSCWRDVGRMYGEDPDFASKLCNLSISTKIKTKQMTEIILLHPTLRTNGIDVR